MQEQLNQVDSGIDEKEAYVDMLIFLVQFEFQAFPLSASNIALLLFRCMVLSFILVILFFPRSIVSILPEA